MLIAKLDPPGQLKVGHSTIRNLLIPWVRLSSTLLGEYYLSEPFLQVEKLKRPPGPSLNELCTHMVERENQEAQAQVGTV